jgi:hypothetical protein
MIAQMSATRFPQPPVIDPAPQGFDAGSINQKHETHEEKPEFTHGHNQTPRSRNHGQSETR